MIINFDEFSHRVTLTIFKNVLCKDDYGDFHDIELKLNIKQSQLHTLEKFVYEELLKEHDATQLAELFKFAEERSYWFDETQTIVVASFAECVAK